MRKFFTEASNTLEKLNLNATGISSSELADTLRKHRSLRVLNIADNQLGDNGIRVLSDAIKLNNTLSTLYLMFNEFGDIGAECLGKALQVNRSIKTLFLNNNAITEKGARALIEALEVNTAVLCMELDNNEISDITKEEIKLLLKRNKDITKNIEYLRQGIKFREAIEFLTPYLNTFPEVSEVFHDMLNIHNGTEFLKTAILFIIANPLQPFDSESMWNIAFLILSDRTTFPFSNNDEMIEAMLGFLLACKNDVYIRNKLKELLDLFDFFGSDKISDKTYHLFKCFTENTISLENKDKQILDNALQQLRGFATVNTPQSNVRSWLNFFSSTLTSCIGYSSNESMSEQSRDYTRL